MWLVIGLTMILLFNLFNKPQSTVKEINYSDFLTNVESGATTEVIIRGNEITGPAAQGGASFKTVAPADTELIPCYARKASTSKSSRLRTPPGTSASSSPGFPCCS